LGDNANPNQAVAATPQLVLPNALVRTADLIRAYNDAGSWVCGYIVNAGGFAGFGSVITYNYTPNDHAGMFQQTYDDLNNYQYILNESEGSEELAYFNAAARTMKALNFQLLVDFYGDVPYTEALQGSVNVQPAYDNAVDIYQDLVSELDAAIDAFQNTPLALPLGTADVMFGGSVTNWAKFANTLKLRLLLHLSADPAQAAFVTANFATWDATLGVLTTDAIINPGYIATDGKMNPAWAQYHSNAAGAASGNGRSRIPSVYVGSFYNGTKLFDTGRGSKVFRAGVLASGCGQLGNQDDSQPFPPTGNMAWYVGTGTGNTVGLFKGKTAGSPILLSAESLFLLAEAQEKAFVAGSAATSFDAGILASFNYLYKDVTGAVVGNPVADIAAYKLANDGLALEYLVDYSLAATPAQRLEAIITQKYIALNFIHGHEAWTEFRRTTYPAIVNGSASPSQSFASLVSTSTRADKLPVRVLYAASEYQLNESNVPSDINQFTDLLFFQPN
jgi:hypothetical protein